MDQVLQFLAKASPVIGTALGGPVGGLIGSGVRVAAEMLTGESEPEAVIANLTGNPELLAQLEEKSIELERTRLIEETKRLQSVNETMRAETQSEDPYVRRWRPTWGYVTCLVWGAQGLALAWVIGDAPEKAPAVISAMAAMTGIWAIALAVLGVSIWKRSDDKKVKAGLVAGTGGGLGEVIGQIIGRKAGLQPPG